MLHLSVEVETLEEPTQERPMRQNMLYLLMKQRMLNKQNMLTVLDMRVVLLTLT